MAVMTPLDWTRAGNMPGGAASRPELFFSSPRPMGGMPVNPPSAASAGIKAAKAVGRVALPVYLGAKALKTADTSTEDFARGMGIGQEQVGQTLWKDLGIRAAGAAADLIPGATTAIRFLNTGTTSEIPAAQRAPSQVTASPASSMPSGLPAGEYTPPSSEAVTKGANMELAARRRRESDALASESGYDVTYDDQGNRRLTPLAPAAGMTSGVPDTGVGGNVYQRQLENMQAMRLRGDLLDQIDTAQRDVARGPTGIGDIPRWQASAQMLGNVMKQAGPGGMREQEQAKADAASAVATMQGRFGMQEQALRNQGAIAAETVRAKGDIEQQQIASAALSANKQAEQLLKLPEAEREAYKTALVQQFLAGDMTREDLNATIAAMGGTMPQDKYQMTYDPINRIFASFNKQRGGIPEVYTEDQVQKLNRIQQLRKPQPQ